MNWGHNLSQHQVFPCGEPGTYPWEFSGTLPDETLVQNKAKRTEWLTNPATKWNIWSAIEGLNPNCRVFKGKQDEGNPAFKIHGLVADIDSTLDISRLEAELGTFGEHQPSYVERTLSGYFRLLWLFQEPLRVPSTHAAKEYLKHALAGLEVKRRVSGKLDAGSEDPTRRWTNSGEWCSLGTSPLSANLTRGWWLTVSKKLNWTAPEFGVTLPLDLIAEALSKKYPRFAEWPGDFSLGSAGPTFWIEGSVSPRSTIVHETGLYTFSQHAHKAFFNWADLLGAEFVRNSTSAVLSKQTEGLYFDGKNYWTKQTDRWHSLSETALKLMLRVDRNVSPRMTSGGTFSPLDEAVRVVQRENRVDGAGPFVYKPQGVLDWNGRRLLNIFQGAVVEPSPEPPKWGAEGSFPFLCGFLESIFQTEEQLTNWLAWLKYFYIGCRNNDLKNGQAHFYLGGVGIGKTFLAQVVIGTLIGGYADASKFLMGQDDFGGELIERAVWCVDDGVMLTDPATQRHFAERVKAVVANRTHSYHKKYEQRTSVLWDGRLLVTGNTDLVSIQCVPEMDISNSDKLSLFRMSDTPWLPFERMESGERVRTVASELPHLGRFLLEYELPDSVRTDHRFGVSAYHSPELMSDVRFAGQAGLFTEMLEDWFNVIKKDVWVGSAYELYRELVQTSGNTIRNLTPAAVTRNLANLLKSGWNIEEKTTDSARTWTIHRPRWVKPEVSKIPPHNDNYTAKT